MTGLIPIEHFLQNNIKILIYDEVNIIVETIYKMWTWYSSILLFAFKTVNFLAKFIRHISYDSPEFSVFNHLQNNNKDIKHPSAAIYRSSAFKIFKRYLNDFWYINVLGIIRGGISHGENAV